MSLHVADLAAIVAPAVPVRERPILFSAPMVRAILEGRKTQTRRTVKPQPTCYSHADWPDESNFRAAFNPDGSIYCAVCMGADQRLTAKDVTGIRNPYGKPGGRLWVRETWTPSDTGGMYDDTVWALYKATEDVRVDGAKLFPQKCTGVPTEIVERLAARIERAEEGGGDFWIPSIHMPRWASRITLEITEVRIQRLQEISEEDAREEGAVPAEHVGTYAKGESVPASYKQGFNMIWQHINGADSWFANPWVWAITFKVVRP